MGRNLSKKGVRFFLPVDAGTCYNIPIREALFPADPLWSLQALQTFHKMLDDSF